MHIYDTVLFTATASASLHSGQICRSLRPILCSHLAVDPVVIRNDQLTWRQLSTLLYSFDCVVISPGPGSPTNPPDIGESSTLHLHTGTLCVPPQAHLSTSVRMRNKYACLYLRVTYILHITHVYVCCWKCDAQFDTLNVLCTSLCRFLLMMTSAVCRRLLQASAPSCCGNVWTCQSWGCAWATR